MKESNKVEDRAPGAEILAEEAVIGAWYVVPSGEIERCFQKRPRGRGTQVGFVTVADGDGEDIRYLQGRTSVLVADEVEAAKAMAVYRESASGSRFSELPLELCPRNGLMCSECGEPQRESPSGATCANGHGGVPGRWRAAPETVEELEDRANQLGVDGYTEEAEALLAEADRLKAEPHEDGLTPEVRPAPRAGPTTIFHKSLHIDHRTPRELFEIEVRRWGPFYLDCAATEENKLCEYALTPEIDALSVDWEGTPEIYVKHGRNRWLNHPYSKGEEPCPADRSQCAKKKCVERGYHIDQRIASSGEWLKYARDQVLKDGIPTDVLTKAAVETNWWRDAIRIQPSKAGAYVGGEVDPLGGPAREFYEGTAYRAATWFRFTWENLVVEVTEIEGRIPFEREGNDGGAGFASALVMFYRPGHVFHG